MRAVAAALILALLSGCVADALAARGRGRGRGRGVGPGNDFDPSATCPPTCDNWTNNFAVHFDGTGDLLLGSATMFFSEAPKRTSCVMYTQTGFAASESIMEKYDGTAKTGFGWGHNPTDNTSAYAPADSGSPTDRIRWAAPASSGQVIDCYVFDLTQAVQVSKIRLYRQEGTEAGFTLEGGTVVANTGTTIRTSAARLSFGGRADGTNLATVDLAEGFDIDAALTAAEVGDLIWDHDSNAATPPIFKHPALTLAADRIASIWGFGDDAGDAVSGGSPQIKDRWGANDLDVNGNPTIVAWSP